MYIVSVEKNFRLELMKFGGMEENSFVGIWFVNECVVMFSVDVDIVKIGWKFGLWLVVFF